MFPGLGYGHVYPINLLRERRNYEAVVIPPLNVRTNLEKPIRLVLNLVLVNPKPTIPGAILSIRAPLAGVYVCVRWERSTVEHSFELIIPMFEEAYALTASIWRSH